jgi:hypothetical protein
MYVLLTSRGSVHAQALLLTYKYAPEDYWNTSCRCSRTRILPLPSGLAQLKITSCVHTYLLHTYIHRVSIAPFYTLPSHPKLIYAKNTVAMQSTQNAP